MIKASNISAKACRASTLPELLVVMIISGILFIAVIDVLSLVRRYFSATAAKLGANYDFYNGFYLLEDMVANADSVSRSGETLELFSSGGNKKVLRLTLDSELLLLHDGMADTLLRDIAAISASAGGHRTDSVAIVMMAENGQVRVAFPINRPQESVRQESFSATEKDYGYERIQ